MYSRGLQCFKLNGNHTENDFFDTHIDIYQEKFFWVIIALFAILKCKCEKNYTFSNIFQKVKSYFLPISIILRVIPVEIPKKV